MPKDNTQFEAIYVDDNSDDQYLFLAILAETGINVDLMTVSGGQAVIDLLNEDNHLPDFIFLDTSMPQDGINCLKEIKKNIKFKDIPVIIFSTSDSSVDIDNSYLDGADLYVVKPRTFKSQMEVMKTIFSMDWKTTPQQSRKEKIVFRGN